MLKIYGSDLSSPANKVRFAANALGLKYDYIKVNLRDLLRSLILPHLGEALRPRTGRRLRMSIDGQPAGYTSPLREGAEVTIRFD